MTRSIRSVGILLLALVPHLFLGISPAGAAASEYVVIGIDNSGSMRGPALQEAVRTAEEFVNRIGSQKRLELFTFARTVSKVESAASLALIRSGGYTSLYDAIWELARISQSLNAPLIIITDGRDSRSSLSVERLYLLLDDVNVPVNIIAFQPRPEDEALLGEIASRTDGSLYGVDTSDQLISTLSDVVEEVEVTRSPQVESEASGRYVAIVIAGATGILSLSLIQMLRRWRRKSIFLDSWGDHLEQFESEDRQLRSDLKSSADPGQIRNSLVSNASIQRILHRVIGDTTLLYPQIKDPITRQFAIFAATIILIAILMLLGSSLFIAIVSAIVIIALVIKALINGREARMRTQFEQELPSAMKLIASSLTSGLSFLQALDTFSTEGKSQVAREFRRALSEIQMGQPIERAFGDVADRMRNEDLRWVVFAFSVQREVGGSLAKILQTSAETIEARASLRQEIKTLSAEGRISSYILILLPPSIFLFLLVTRPNFISLFWRESIGHILLGLIVILMILSWAWIKRLIRIEA